MHESIVWLLHTTLTVVVLALAGKSLTVYLTDSDLINKLRLKYAHIFSQKPFTCAFCMSFWVSALMSILWCYFFGYFNPIVFLVLWLAIHRLIMQAYW
jgi:hypothetical protein